MLQKRLQCIFPFGLEKAVFDQLFQVDSSQVKTTNQQMPCVISGRLKSPWLNYKCERRDHCSFGHHSITVTVERWDEFHIFDGRIENIRYNPIGKKIEYDWSAFCAPAFMFLEVTLLTKPFSLFSSIFRLTLQGHSQNKTSSHLTDRICSVFLPFFRNPHKSFVHPQTFILENKE